MKSANKKCIAIYFDRSIKIGGVFSGFIEPEKALVNILKSYSVDENGNATFYPKNDQLYDECFVPASRIVSIQFRSVAPVEKSKT